VPYKRAILIGSILAAVVFAGVTVWDWIMPHTSSLRHATPADLPEPGLSLVAPGMVKISLGSRVGIANAVALQADGTIVVAANAWQHLRAIVLRLTPDGRLASPAVTQLTRTISSVDRMLIAKDGTALMAGYGYSKEQLAPGTGHRHWFFARLQANGAFDPEFAGGAAMLADLRSDWFVDGGGIADVAIDDDGGIVATGIERYAASFFDAGSYCATARFGRDGSFDRSFADHGRVLSLFQRLTDCLPRAVFISPDRSITVIGTAGKDHGQYHIVAFRYLPDGAPDRQFGKNGAYILEENASVAKAAMDSKGRIVTVGAKDDRLLVGRYDIHGNADSSFGQGQAVSLLDPDVRRSLTALTLQTDGKIVVAGTNEYLPRNWNEPPVRSRIAIVRLNENGTLDESFAGGGYLDLASPTYSWSARGVTVQPDGKLLIAGSTSDDEKRLNSSILLVRLNPDGTPDKDFGNGL
jgi:uncharacterized delta-60 repeat protein